MKFALYALLFIAMTLTVPWFFSAGEEAEPAATSGLPFWVVYVIGLSVGYACLVAVLVHFFWDTSADGEETESERRIDG